MESYLCHNHYDLITPDGQLTSVIERTETTLEGVLQISNISPVFKGYDIPQELIIFNLKSTLAQLGVHGEGQSFEFDPVNGTAQAQVSLKAYGQLGRSVLASIEEGSFIGKLFAADDRRRVRDPDYLHRMVNRADKYGEPLLMLGGLHGSTDLVLDKIDGRTVAYLSLRQGVIRYTEDMNLFIPTLSKALKQRFPLRELISLHQVWCKGEPRVVEEGEILLVKTLPLHIRTVFGRVVNEHLSKGFQHTSASILQPDTQASGDIYELFGNSQREISDIPLEFYTLEPHREHIFFEDRDQLKESISKDESLFKAFETAPGPREHRAAVFVVKGEQLLNLKESDWIIRHTHIQEFPGLSQPVRQQLMVDRYISQQPSYPFLKAMEDDLITSQGILLTKHLPSPLMKRMLLSHHIRYNLKQLYFQHPSMSNDDFFSYEDQAFLHDLLIFAIGVYWVDCESGRVLQYTQKQNSDAGMFVPPDKVPTFLNSTVLGVYGSNLQEGNFEEEVSELLQGLYDMRQEVNHPLLNPDTPLSLVTGGGPGAMEVGNRVAKKLGILSCANIVDFRQKDGSFVNEQLQNPHIEAKMTYRLDKLVERQAAFNLDLPIILMGGIGTDFELMLEEACRKVGSGEPTPVLLFGSRDYWRAKITGSFRCNMEYKTTVGSEWISNCFFCVQTAAQGLKVYRQFFEGSLKIGPEGPIYDEGFVSVPREEKGIE